jgi:hypothetical protein
LLALFNAYFAQVAVKCLSPAVTQEDGVAITIRIVANVEHDTVLDRKCRRPEWKIEVYAWMSEEGTPLKADPAKEFWAFAKMKADRKITRKGQVA